MFRRLLKGGGSRSFNTTTVRDQHPHTQGATDCYPELLRGDDSLCQAVHHTSSITRARLTEADALDIFHCKAHSTSAASVSKKFGVIEKAVRDIWTGRTWSKETWHLDTSRSRPLKKMGRPVGRKDAKPRKPRVVPSKLESSKLRDAAAAISHLDRHQSTASWSLVAFTFKSQIKKCT